MKKILLSCLFFIVLALDTKAMPQFDTVVSVDETAKTVSEAKRNALSKAMRKGLNEIVLMVSTEDSLKEINKLNDNQMEHFIKEVMVLMEKTSDVRYIADFKISVDGDLLKAYLKENNFPIIINAEQEVVIIPVLESEDGNLDVWADDNEWRLAFVEKSRFHKGNVNFRLIDKNLGNIAMIKANRLYDIRDGEYQELVNFNHADGILVLKYSTKDSKIYSKSYPNGDESSISFEKDTFLQLVEKALSLYKGSTKVADKAVSVDEIQKIEIVYNYVRLSDWMGLKSNLEGNPQVQNVNIISMANGKVHFNFDYAGIIEQLQGHLAVYGYKMVKEGEHYVIN